MGNTLKRKRAPAHTNTTAHIDELDLPEWFRKKYGGSAFRMRLKYSPNRYYSVVAKVSDITQWLAIPALHGCNIKMTNLEQWIATARILGSELIKLDHAIVLTLEINETVHPID